MSGSESSSTTTAQAASHSIDGRPSHWQVESVASLLGAVEVRPILDLVFAQLHRAFSERDAEFPSPASKVIRQGSGLKVPQNPSHQDGAIANLVIQGASTEAELRTMGLVAVAAIRANWPVTDFDREQLALALLWLEAHAKLPMLSLLALELDGSQRAALGESLRALSTDTKVASDYLVRCAALLWAMALESSNSCADVMSVISPTITQLLGEDRPPASNRSGNFPPISGRILATRRGPLATAVSAFTGWLLLRRVFETISRAFLGYRAEARVRLGVEGVEVSERRSLLGRTLREKSYVISIRAVRRMSRELQYARAGTYAGLATLAIGSLIGMRLFLDGVRAPGFSFQTLVLGVAVIIGGLVLDFALATWLDQPKKGCRLAIETFQGPSIILACEGPVQVDRLLQALATQLKSTVTG